MRRGYSAPNLMLSPIDEILADLRTGKMVALVDEREGGDGVLCMAAERVTPDAINFMATHARGLISLALTGPGAYSLDAHLFGRQEIIIPPRPPSSAD